MDAAEALVQKILEGSKQFLVPHFQRPYTWREEQWRALWEDVVERIDSPDGAAHFIGPIVTGPARSIPEGVEKRLLIDGQQRLTTIVVLLTAIRDEARKTGQEKVAERIQDLITNRHEEGLDRFKVLPTQGESVEESDRAALAGLIDCKSTLSKSAIVDARRFFDKRLQGRDAPAVEPLFTALARKVTLVSIKLGEHDNPYRIFESLNGKGRPLTQGDLIRNFFFMRIPQGEHEQVYSELWRPMQKRLGEESLTDFIRHDLTATTGTVIRETDVYAMLKDRVDADNDPITHLRRLSEYAVYYEVLLKPELAATFRLRGQLERIRRLEVTVAYPLLLPAYAEYRCDRLPEAELSRLVEIVETYVLRRFVAGVATYGLNKIFAPLFVQCRPVDGGFVQRVADILATKDCPRDSIFRERVQTSKLYGGGERREKVKVILERLEASAGHKESIDPQPLTIEHVMPQSLTPEWLDELGADAGDVHSDLLHSLGNLTLTGYNSELGNLPFATKRERYAASHLELNAWFGTVEHWTRLEIERRAAALTEQALKCWPWSGPAIANADSADDDRGDDDDVTGTVPRELLIRGVTFPARSWADVARVAAGFIVSLGDPVFDSVAAEVPKFLNRDATAFRRSSKLVRLPNGAYVETNLSAQAIHRWSRTALAAAGVWPEDWSVALAQNDHEEADADTGGSELGAQQLAFWTEARKSLAATNTFPSLQAPASQMWFDIALGRANIHMTLITSFRDRRVGVRITIQPNRVERALPQLMAQRTAIEAELDLALDWDPHPGKRVRTIKIWHAIDVANRANWSAAIEWLTTVAAKMHRSFAPRVMKLVL